MKKILFLVSLLSLISVSSMGYELVFKHVASADASQYSSNQFTARMSLGPIVKDQFKSSANSKCQDLGGSLVESKINQTDFTDLTLMFRYTASGEIKCEVPEEGVCAAKYDLLDPRQALSICRSLRSDIDRDIAAQCLANALQFETSRYFYFGESRSFALSYCVKATQMGKGEEFATKILYAGSLAEHFSSL